MTNLKGTSRILKKSVPPKRKHEQPNINHPQGDGKRVKLPLLPFVSYNKGMAQRRVFLMDNLSFLIGLNKEADMINTADMIDWLKHSSCMHLEWDKGMERSYLFISCLKKNILIKFELEAIFKGMRDSLTVKRHRLCFSSGFGNGNGWKHVQDALIEIFQDADNKKGEYDYLYSFTRIGCTIHFSVYEIGENNLLGSGTLNTTGFELKLKKVDISFAINLIELSHLDDGQLVCNGAEFAEPSPQAASFILSATGGLASSECDQTQHKLHNVEMTIYLPRPQDISAFSGFNSTFVEYVNLHRSEFMERVAVHGSNGSYDRASSKFNHMFRNILKCVGKVIQSELCIPELLATNLLIRKDGAVKLYGVAFAAYSEEIAKANLSILGSLANYVFFNGQPEDVLYATTMLAYEPIESYDLVVNSVAWMSPLSRKHVVIDITNDCRSFLSADEEVAFYKRLSDVSTLEVKCKANTLLEAVRLRSLPKDPADLASWKANRLQNFAKSLSDPKDAVVLHEGRLYVGTVRNSYEHLPEHGRKANPAIYLAPKCVDNIVSSQFTQSIAEIQRYSEGSLNGKSMSTHTQMSTSERYKPYFSEPEDSSEFV